MVKYKAAPFYAIACGKSTLQFNYFGTYETDDEAEIEAIDALVPIWVTKDVEVAEDAEETKPEEVTEPVVETKPASKRKASAK